MRRTRDAGNIDHDSDDDIPLQHKRAFGSGLKRKRVEFVPAQDPDSGISITVTTSDDNKSKVSVGDLYASVVLSKGEDASADPSSAAHVQLQALCAQCALPVTTSLQEHEASLAHQVSVAHSHPPSSLDRTRMGLRALSAQGWDPDARVGLGREGEGMRFPIKVAGKEDNLGIGAMVPGPDKDREAMRQEKEKEKKTPSAREARAQVDKDKKRADRLQQEIFGSVDVERYLGRQAE